jgi:hypothetical protein
MKPAVTNMPHAMLSQAICIQVKHAAEPLSRQQGLTARSHLVSGWRGLSRVPPRGHPVPGEGRRGGGPVAAGKQQQHTRQRLQHRAGIVKRHGALVAQDTHLRHATVTADDLLCSVDALHGE